MPMLIVKCPATGKEIPTGIVMKREEFKAAELSPHTVNCPSCRHPHTWYKSDAFFETTTVLR